MGVGAASVGGFVTKSHSSQVSARHVERPVEAVAQRSGLRAPPPEFPSDAKWPAWKVSVFVIVFCGAFWTAAIYLGVRLFG